MRPLAFFGFFLLVFISCSKKEVVKIFTTVEVEDVFLDSVSIRAIEFLDQNTLAFAGSDGVYGTVDVASGKIRSNTIKYDSIVPFFRAVAHTNSDFFMLSVGSPALLYKTGDNGQMELVYTEVGETVFYDSMMFWNNLEGLAVGDTVDGCLSIIITRDGGATWRKIPCNELPEGTEGEGAFAASNTNIEVMGNQAWIATTTGSIYHTMDRGTTWNSIGTPMENEVATQGIYSIDFYDQNVGIAIGGDYTKPEVNTQNKIKTEDGGKTWQLIADGQYPGYRSCIQFVPNRDGKAIVAVGFNGISYSSDGGDAWTQLSKEGFYTIRFLSDSVAYAAGKHRISKLIFR
ncbi:MULTISPECIES: WD40/YVTN/BNR-like repeat-containing protein [Maribacter]|uniref:Oxidoreductase n=1 Tax=Maribacter flavus TaxID=1658664 RepID=A0A5B2TRR6_9FLAO|nr:MULTISPECIES: oxidoreductase [Maribacter]KAA2216793.1 oxidoreductase [Maribacter flavus]MDC6406070.1 oxidoreductase [Maribacter sp. PR66]MEE1973145.1 oxidoreductase [Maribacter flavus]